MSDPTMTDDEIATQQAAGEAVAAPVSGEPVAAEDPTKSWFRANVSWVMAEINYLEMGKSADDRAALNP